MNRPVDLREWLECIRMSACRFPSAFPPGSDEFALELVEDGPRLEWLEELIGDVENEAGNEFKDKPDKAVERLVERSQMLFAIEEAAELTLGEPHGTDDIGDQIVGFLQRLGSLAIVLRKVMDKTEPTLAEQLGLEHDL